MTINHTWMQNNTYAARLDRLALEGIAGEEGVLGYNSFEVVPSGSTLSVDVAAGWAAILGDDQSNQGMYLVHNDASANVAFSAPGSDSWYVGILLQVQDPNATGPAGDDVILTIVTGSSSPTPSKPTVPDSALVLTWLVVPSTATIGTDATDEADHVLAALNPTGMIIPWAAPTAITIPNGWLLCDGGEANRITYACLFALVGTVYGVGNGSTTFDLPDLRGRMPMGLDNMGGVSANRVGDSQADTVGGSGGADTHTLTEAQLPSHLHAKGTIGTSTTSPGTSSDGNHNHTFGDDVYVGIGGPSNPLAIPSTALASVILTLGAAGAHTHTVNAHTHTVTGSTATTGSGSAHTNMPPYFALQFLIKT